MKDIFCYRYAAVASELLSSMNANNTFHTKAVNKSKATKALLDSNYEQEYALKLLQSGEKHSVLPLNLFFT